MPGIIVGAQGFQRSGKTLLMYLIASQLSKTFHLPVYSNVFSSDPTFHYINSINDLPFNFEPKILFIDEIYNGTDAQNWKELKDISIFINTIGKQNILFLYTTIDFKMVYNRIRNQTKYSIFVKSDDDFIYYRMIDTEKMTIKDFKIEKTQKLFSNLKYDSCFVPLDFSWDMKSFNTKLVNYYKQSYPIVYDYFNSSNK